MNELINRLTESLGPAMSSSIGHALVGVIILVVGLFVVRLLAGLFSRLLSRVDFLQRTNPDGSVTNLASPIVSLIRGVLSVFVLMAVLQHFGLTDVLVPLREMVNKFTTAIPNIVGAGVIAYAGWLIAKIVSELAGIALRKVDQQIAERTGNEDLRIAGFGSGR